MVQNRTVFLSSDCIFKQFFIFCKQGIAMDKKVVFLGMGGTIAGRSANADDGVGYRAGEVGVAALLAGVPALALVLAGHEVCTEQVAQIDSKNMAWSHWARLAERVSQLLADPLVRSVVVTHGTDTLEETAYFLSCVVPAPLLQAKPVVMTCAMRPATALVPDGPQNLLDAAAVALDARAHGVLVLCAGRVHAALHVQKVHPYHVDAFDSGEAGALAEVEEGRVRWLAPCPDAPAPVLPPNVWQAWLERPADWPRVEIVMSYAGASAAVVQALCASGVGPSVRGLVVAGTGNGTVHAELEQALLQAQSDGVCVVRTSRCAYGRVVLARVAEPQTLRALPLSAVKARIAVMLELMAAV